MKHTKINLEVVERLLRRDDEMYNRILILLLNIQQKIFNGAYEYVASENADIPLRRQIIKCFLKLNEIAHENYLPPVFPDLQYTSKLDLLYEAGLFTFWIRSMFDSPKDEQTIEFSQRQMVTEMLKDLQNLGEPHGIKVFGGDIDHVSDDGFMSAIEKMLFGFVDMMIERIEKERKRIKRANRRKNGNQRRKL